MTLCVESQPAYSNAPVALLLLNGTIVMVPDGGKNGGTKTSKEQYQHHPSANLRVEANFTESKQNSKLRETVDQRISQPRVQGCIHVGPMEQDSSVFHHHQLKDPFIKINTDFNGSVLLQNSIDRWIEKPCNTPSENVLTYTNSISSKACKRLGNAQICDPRTQFRDTDVPEYEFRNSRGGISNADNLKPSTKLKRNDAQFRYHDISTGSRSNKCNVNSPYGGLLNISPEKNEFLYATSRTQGFPDKSYEEVNSSDLSAQNTLASTNQESSKVCRRGIYDSGIRDRVERGGFRNSRDLTPNADKLKFDPTAQLYQADVQLCNLDISAGSPCMMYNGEAPNDYLNYYSPSAENKLRYASARTPEHDGSSDINHEMEASNDYITRLVKPMPSKKWWPDCSYKKRSIEDHETGYSKSKHKNETKGDSAGLRLNLLGDMNLMENDQLENQKPIFGSQKHEQEHVLKARRLHVSNEENTFVHNQPGPRRYSQNESVRGCHISLDNEDSIFEDPLSFSDEESETPAQNEWLRCGIMETAVRNVLKEKRERSPGFEECGNQRDTTYQRPNVKKGGDFCDTLGKNIDVVPEYPRRRSIEDDFANSLKRNAVLSCPQLGVCQKPPPPSRAQQSLSYRGQTKYMNDDTPIPLCRYHCTNVKALKANNISDQLKGSLKCPSPIPENDYTSKVKGKSMMAPTGPRPGRFHSNSMYCRGECIDDRMSQGNCENRRRAFERTIGLNVEAEDDCKKCDSVKELHFLENSRPETEIIFELKNEHGVLWNQQPVYMQEKPSINVPPRILQQQIHQGIAPMIQYTDFPLFVPHLLHHTSCGIESAAPYDLFEKLKSFLDQYPECQVLEASATPYFPISEIFPMPSPMNYASQSTDLLVDSTMLSWMVLPTHHSTMNTGYPRNWYFCPCFPLPPQPMSFASFVIDEDDHWWLIHFETNL